MFCAAILSLSVTTTLAGPREQAKRIHDRIAGVPPAESVLTDMAADISGGDPEAAAYTAMENRHFYDVTIKNMAMPWTNEAQTAFAPLNDYVATVVGLIRDDADFRRVLYDDVIYIAPGVSPAYSPSSNAHYEAIEDQNLDLSQALEERLQSNMHGGEVPPQATAGVLTTRQAAKAFFKDGTNRAMFRFTLMNHMCRDLEQVKDISLSPDRIRQDVSRSPGGDSRIYQNSCVGCHTGMDPMAQAFAYYNYQYDGDADPDGENGRLIYNTAGETDPETDSRVTAKHRINAETFPYGYIITDDQWDNYWRQGKNQVLGWDFAPVDPNIDGSGSGMKSLGKELAGSRAFAECQVKKVFRTVCLRPPTTSSDHDQIDSMVTSLSNSGFQLKRSFADAAVYCSTDVQ
ncbi:hypothetical protein H0Z60_13710 [Ectothiorhodospiraceae bacterium WFHF3C12]|nr:hypothetical protein [Ectothiorhodospiraceae bacterium WFHF3C12]